MIINKNDELYEFYIEAKRKVDYCSESGDIVWSFDFHKFKKGNIAGSTNGIGYRRISIRLNSDRKNLAVHRLVWFIYYGELPSIIDHINRDRSDNRISNLRVCTNSQNQVNKNIQKNNTTGYKGVYLNKSKGNWFARVKKNGKSIHLGMFDSPEKASDAYIKKSRELFGEFSSLR